MYDQFYINKLTDTPADLLLLYGFTSLIMRILPVNGDYEATMEDKGYLFYVGLNKPLLTEHIDHTQLFALNPFLKTSADTAPSPPKDFPEMEIFSYDFYKGIKKEYWRKYRNLRKTYSHEQTERQLSEQGVDAPHPYWQIWNLINTQHAITAYSKVIEIWHRHRGEIFPQFLHLVLHCFASPLNNLEELQADWQKLINRYAIEEQVKETATQIAAPGMGKGSSYTKATNIREEAGEDFWLLTYLRYAGLYAGCIALEMYDPDQKKKPEQSKDRKNYIPIPNKTQWTTFQIVFRKYQQALGSNTAVKLDILATLYYISTHLAQWKQAQGEDLPWIEPNPFDHIRAIDVISLKKVGSSHAVMRMNELNIPKWINIETIDDAEVYLAIVEEHRKVIESIKERKEYELLRYYRDFLSAKDMKAFGKFIRGYFHLTMSRLHQGEYSPVFSPKNMEVVLMAVKPNIREIYENRGFQAIATAMRNSTIALQFRPKDSRTYDVRYGLGDKIARAGADASAFLKELNEFVYLYNRETGQHKDNTGKHYRDPITPAEMEAFTEIYEKYDPELLATCLIAYATCYEIKSKAQQGE